MEEKEQRKKICFCIDVDSYTEQMMTNRGACGYYDYLQTQYAIKKGISPMVVSNMAFLDYGLIDKGYDIYLCYKDKAVKIEQDMKLPVRYAAKDFTSKVMDSEIHCTGTGLWLDEAHRRFDSLLEAFQAGLFHEVLGVKPYKIKEG